MHKSLVSCVRDLRSTSIVSTDTADSPSRAMLLVIKWGTLHVQNAITNLDEMRV